MGTRTSAPMVNDPDRLRALRSTGLLDTGPEESFDRLGRLAQRLVSAPVALVSLVDSDRQFFKCCVGLAEPYATAGETPLSHSICQYTLENTGPLVISDVRTHADLADSLAVVELGALAYLGIPLTDGRGHVLGSFCVIDHKPRVWSDEDVAIMVELAESVMAEIELREVLRERNRLAAITETTTDMVGLADTRGKILSVNTAMLTALGRSPDDLIGHGFDAFAGDGWSHAVRAENIATALRTGSWQGRAEFIRSDLSSLPVSVLLIAHDEDGTITNLSIVARDMTQEDAAARQAEASAARLRAIMDSLFIFVGLLTVDGTLTEANAAALDAAGLTADDVLGLPFWDTYWWNWDPDLQNRLRAAIEEAAGGKIARYDAVVRLRDDLRITIDFQLVPIRDAAGTIVGIVASGLDISERKIFEDDLARVALLERTERARAESLLRLANALTGAAGVDDITAQVISLGTEVVGANFSNIAIVDPETNQLELRHGAELDRAISDRWPRVPIDATTPLGSAIITGTPVFLDSPTAIEREYPVGAADAAAAGLCAIAAFPARNGRVAVGYAWTTSIEMNDSIRYALATVAELAGQAFERAELYERERRVADQLQRSLLPRVLLPVPDTDIVARYEAAAGLQVGGDWYDIGMLAENRYVLAVGDVVGRGLESAAAMGALRHAFSALASNAMDLEFLVQRLDQFSCDTENARFSTMVAVEVAPGSGQIRVVSAGHLPPMIRRQDGSVHQVESGGPPLGFDADVDRVAVEAAVAPGDALVLYTDGLVERRGEHIDVSLRRLRTLLESASFATAEELGDHVYNELGRDRDDDVALLICIF